MDPILTIIYASSFRKDKEDELMTHMVRSLVVGLVFLGLLAWTAPAARAVEIENPFVIQPGRYATVNGNVTKFQNQHWMKDGFVAGVGRFSLKEERKDGVVVEFDGRAIVDEDYEVALKIEQEDRWYIHTDFSQWIRYYDVRGGSDAVFPLTSATGLDKELALNIGNFGIELGLLFDAFPDIKLRYEHEYKDGAKSRLTWAMTPEPPGNRKIMPAFETIDETADSLELELTHKILGFDVTATQHWEFVRDQSELIQPDNITMVREPDDSDTDIFSTILKFEKWFSKDTVFIGASYRHINLDNTVLNELFEYSNITGATVTNSHASFDNTAFNKYDSHAVLANSLVRPFGWKDWTVITKAKAEWIRKDGLSVNNHDETPNGIIDYSFWRDSENQIDSLAEAVSVRYTGIDRMALYGEFEFEQIDNFVDENAWGINGAAAAGTGNTYYRQTAMSVNGNSNPAGIRASPLNDVDLTSQYRYRSMHNDYDNQKVSHPGTSPESAFINSLFLKTHEFSSKLTYRPTRKVRPSVRYQHKLTGYDTIVRLQNQVQSREETQIISADLYIQALDNLSLTGTYQLSLSHIVTPAEISLATRAFPASDMDYHSWMIVADWMVNDALTATGSVVHTIANDNFNAEQSAYQLMYGAEYNQLDLNVGLQWKVKEGVVVEPKYAFYHYDGKHLDAAGDYDAHVFWLKVGIDLG